MNNKKKIMQWILGILAIIVGIALIAVCSCFVNGVPDDWLQAGPELWKMFGYIVGLIIGVSALGLGILTISCFIYLSVTKKQLIKTKAQK